MKIRYGYVGNSSSCSFIIDKTLLTQYQIESILNHEEVGKEKKLEYYNEGWRIWDLEDKLVGETGMDNFDMEQLCEILEIPKNAIKWDTNNGYTYGVISNEPGTLVGKLRKSS